MSERLIELMATIRAPVRRDWKEMRRAFRVRLAWFSVFLGCGLVLGVFLILSRKKALEAKFLPRLPLLKCGLM